MSSSVAGLRANFEEDDVEFLVYSVLPLYFKDYLRRVFVNYGEIFLVWGKDFFLMQICD